MRKEHFCTTETPQKITEMPRKITENHGKSRKITENHGKSRKGFFMPITEIVESLVFLVFIIISSLQTDAIATAESDVVGYLDWCCWRRGPKVDKQCAGAGPQWQRKMRVFGGHALWPT